MPVPLDTELPIRDAQSGFLIGYVTIPSRLMVGPCKPNEAGPQGWIKLDVPGRGYAWLQWHERRRTLTTDDLWVRGVQWSGRCPRLAREVRRPIIWTASPQAPGARVQWPVTVAVLPALRQKTSGRRPQRLS